MKKGFPILAALFAAPAAFAATLHVTPTGAGARNGSDWDNAFAGIQAAVDAADAAYLADGTVRDILVADGTYSRVVVTNDFALQVRSVNGAAATIVDGGGTNGCLRVQAGGAFPTAPTFTGFTFRNGDMRDQRWDDQGGGAAGGTLVDCIVEDCSADSGGGTYCSDTLRCVIRRCRASGWGGGVYRGTHRNTVVYHSRAYCGVIHDADLRDCTVADNGSDSNAIRTGGSARGCIFWGNAVDGVAVEVVNDPVEPEAAPAPGSSPSSAEPPSVDLLEPDWDGPDLLLESPPAVEPVPAPAAEPVPAPAAEPVPAPVAEPVPAPAAAEPVPAPAAAEPVPAPAAEFVPAPVAEPVPVPAAEPVPAPAVEPVPAPAAEPVPAPVAEPVPTPAAEPVPAPAAAEPVPATAYVFMTNEVNSFTTANAVYVGRDYCAFSPMENAWTIRPMPLPFPFPYFGAEYTNVWIHSDGLVAFGEAHPLWDGSLYAPSDAPGGFRFSEAAFLEFPAIAPYLHDSYGSLYTIFDESSATILWSSHRRGDVGSVCVSLTLRPDGSFDFKYSGQPPPQDSNNAPHARYGYSSGTGEGFLRPVGGSLSGASDRSGRPRAARAAD